MALAQYTDRALRFAACVPRHLQSKFNVFMKDNLGLAMPPCDQAGIFDLHEHFTFHGLGDLRRYLWLDSGGRWSGGARAHSQGTKPPAH